MTTMLGFLCCNCYLTILWIICLPIFLLKIYAKLTTGWCYSQTCLKNKTAIVTGANSGIGYETALDLAKRGAKVILACRDSKRGEEARLKIIQETDNTDVILKLVDFNSFASVRAFANEILKEEDKLDILVNNAGLAGIGDVNTEDGLPAVMQVNYFAPFLLTNLLLGLLKKTESSRIVNVSSLAAKYAKFDLKKIREYVGDTPLYFRSKLCNILFTKELAEKLNGTTVTTYSLHPGVVITDLFRRMPKIMQIPTTFAIKSLFKSSLEGAQTSIYLAVAKNIEKLSGEHFHDCQQVKCYKTASDEQLAKDLWIATEEIVKLAENEKHFL